jgi:hypothetical protein
MKEVEVEQEVARRVRRVTGFKFMRDMHKAADETQRERQNKPLLIFKLVSLVVGFALLYVLYLKFS